MPAFSSFLGGSYSGRAFAADGERSVNWFPERVESKEAAKSEWVMIGRPGLKTFAALTGTSVQALCEINGRCFAVCSGTFCELKSDGTKVSYGAVQTGRAQMVASQSQVVIVAGASGYCFSLTSQILTPITNANFPANPTKLGISDAYFFALEGGTQNVAFSALNDGITWAALDYLNAQGEPGNIVSILVDHRQLWLLSETHSEIYYDSGDANTPWTRLEGAFMEQGCGALDSPVRCDNTIFWLGSNPNGGGMAWRANGYTPERISTHAIESIWQDYPTIADASAYCYQEDGHTFYRVDFPSANAGLGATWLYDVASGFWHERTHWSNGTEQADLARCYCYVFGKHLVGDYQSGTVYEQNLDYATDAGAPIRRLRSAPSLGGGRKQTFYSQLTLLMQVGVGLDGGVTPGSDPKIVLQISNDGGLTWGNERPTSMGKLGAFRQLVTWRRLGRSRNRSFRVICTEPVEVVLVGCELETANA